MVRKLCLFLTIFLMVAMVAACGGNSASDAADEATAEPVAAESENEAESEESEPEESEPEETEAEEADTSTEETAADASAGESNADAAAEGMRTFVIVSDESQASYIVQEEFFAGALSKLGIQAGNYEVQGTTSGVEGQLALDLGNATVGENHFTVDLTGLQTEQNRRDDWIQENGPTFASFPTAEFVATEIQNAPENYTEGEEANFQLVGDLTVRDVTQPVTFDVTATLDGDTIQGVATTTLLMSDFGIEPPSFANTLTVADEFRIEIELTAREQ